MDNKKKNQNLSFILQEYLPVLVFGLILILLPLVITNPMYIGLIVLANIYSVYVASWDILSGYSGQVNFGHSLFIGGGAYTAGLLNFHFHVPPIFTIFIGGAAAAMLGLIIGIPCLRIRGPYLALATFAASAIPYGLATVLWTVTGGEEGLYGLTPIAAELTHRYYLSVLLLFAAGGVLLALGRSRIGLILKSIREDEIGAMASGINTVKFKLSIFVISGFFAGLAGAFYTHHQLNMSKETLSLELSILVVIMSVVGGLGTITGPVAGAFLLTIFNEMLRGVEEFRLLIYTLVVVLILLFLPRGVLPTVADGINSLLRKKER